MENKKFNRSEHMKARYAERRKKMLGESNQVNQQNESQTLDPVKNKMKKQIEKEDRAIKAQILKEKRKIYSAKAYQKRKEMIKQFKQLNSSKQNVEQATSIKKISSDSKSLIFKINNSEQKEITIRIDV